MNILRKIRLKASLIAIVLLSVFIVNAQKDIQLNLKNADLRAFIETVSKITGRKFVIDPDVQGNVTLISPETLDKKSLYDVFLTVLDVHGFSAVDTGSGLVKVIPNNKKIERNLGYDGVIRIYKLNHINANEILPTLKSLMPAGSQVTANPSSNVLIISGSGSDVSRAMDVIARIDGVNNSEFEVIRLRNASATNISKTVNALIASENKNSSMKIVADERTNSILLKASKSDKLRLKTLITHLDTPIENAGNTEVIYLKNANATSVAEVLSSAKNSIKQTSESNVINLTNTGSNDSPVDIRADATTNSLIVTAPPATMRNLKQVIAKLDIRRSQVLVEAIIAEVSTNDINNLGVQWYGSGGGGSIPVGLINFSNAGSSILGIGASYAGYLADQTVNTSSVSDGATFGIGNRSLGILVNALNEKTDSNILSTPSLLVMDNEEAEMIVGENIPYVTGSYTTSGDGSSNPFTTVERQDIGVKLLVKPQISEGDTISLNIYQEVSDILSNDARLGPSTTKRALKTSVLVESNQVLVLGGLIDNRKSKSAQKVPILGDIPLIGNLFKSTKRSGVERNLMIFIRPRILRNKQTANIATQEKYNLIRNAQIASPLKNTKKGILPPISNPLTTEYESEPVNYLPKSSNNSSWNAGKKSHQNPAPVFDRSQSLH